MTEAGIEIFIGAIASLAIVTVIQFAERAYRYKRVKENKSVGSYGFHTEEYVTGAK